MPGLYLPPPFDRAVDPNGVPYNGAKIQFYLSGTTTPASVYSSAALSTPLANPVVSDSAGVWAPIFLDPAVTYRAQWLNPAGALLQDVDPVAAPITVAAGSVTAAMLASGVALGNLGFTPVNKAGDTATNLLLSNSTLAANSAGYIGAPLNEQDAAYTLALADAGKLVRANSGVAIAWTIPPVGSVAWPVGTAIVVRNVGAGVVTLTRGAGVSQVLAGANTAKDVALAQYGIATLMMEGANAWVISGVGIS